MEDVILTRMCNKGMIFPGVCDSMCDIDKRV